jgi:hypothetical protein
MNWGRDRGQPDYVTQIEICNIHARNELSGIFLIVLPMSLTACESLINRFSSSCDLTRFKLIKNFQLIHDLAFDLVLRNII